MTSLDAYLDGVCEGLRVNPAEAEDIREELRSHLEELVRRCRENGMGGAEAMEASLSCFGEANRLHECLDRVHQGDAWWVLRLKGLGFGVLLGGLLGVIIPVGGHLDFIPQLRSLPSMLDPSHGHILINAMLAGGLIGLLSAGGRGLLAGWSVGSLLWLAEYVIYWVMSVARTSGSGDGGLSLMNSVLLAPLLGGIFGAAVGAVSAAILSAASRVRPQIQ